MAKEKSTTLKKETTKNRKTEIVGTRGRVFYGDVARKIHDRVAIEFERPSYIKKYERFMKKKTRLHARVPEGMNVEIGDYIKVQECRPLSKIIHFIVVEVVRKKSDKNMKGKGEEK